MNWFITIKDPFGRIRAPIKIEVMDLEVFKMILGTNKSRTLWEHILCECRCVNKNVTMRSLSVSVKMQ